MFNANERGLPLKSVLCAISFVLVRMTLEINIQLSNYSMRGLYPGCCTTDLYPDNLKCYKKTFYKYKLHTMEIYFEAFCKNEKKIIKKETTMLTTKRHII